MLLNLKSVFLGICISSVCMGVMSDSLQPHGLLPSRLLHPWNFPVQNTGVGCHFLLQGILPTQGSNSRLLHLLHQQVDSLPLHHLGSHTNFCKPSQFQIGLYLAWSLVTVTKGLTCFLRKEPIWSRILLSPASCRNWKAAQSSLSQKASWFHQFGFFCLMRHRLLSFHYR